MGQCCIYHPPTASQKTIDHSTSNIPLRSVYQLGRVLGQGQFGLVRLANRIGSSKEKFAIKSIKKYQVSNFQHFKREIDILIHVDHPHIIRLYDTFQDSKQIHMVMQYCKGGDLFQKMSQKQRFSQPEAKNLMRQMLMSINHLHNIKIVHRDIKPENFLFDLPGKEGRIKLADFGLSNRFGQSFDTLHSCVGTMYYIAPEVLTGSYDKKCDIWSLGVILYIMLSGKIPFAASNLKQLYRRIQTAAFSMKNHVWDTVSDQAKDLISNLLKRNPSQRFSAQKALEHPWFLNCQIKKSAIKESVMNSFRQYRSASAFQKEALNILVKHIPAEEIQGLNQAFFAIDPTGTGQASFGHFRKGVQESGFQVSENELQQIADSIGIHNQGVIKYSEFLAAAVYGERKIEDEQIQKAFKHFDLDNTGFIVADNLKLAFGKLGMEVPNKVIEEVLSNSQNEEKITFKEFKNLLVRKTI